MTYRLLREFRDVFQGQAYLHRRSNTGDFLARAFYEDLYDLGRSKRLVERVESRLSVVNAKNARQGIEARRGDGSFGEIVPNAQPAAEAGYRVGRGPIATIEIGIEVKILMKAMIKQIDRVCSDLRGQADHFRSKGGQPIVVGVAAVNEALFATSYEGSRAFRTDGRKHKHPKDEAAEAIRRLAVHAAPMFDEFLVLRFVATNEAPFNFAWANESETNLDFGAVLARISQAYERRIS